MRLKDRVLMRRFWKRFSLLSKTGSIFLMRLKYRVQEVLEDVLPPR
jgi:hypothetical protein